MGEDSFTSIILLSSPPSHKPAALTTDTGVGPVMLNSLPLAVMLLQNIGFENTSCSTSGAHPGFVRLSIGVGNKGYTVTGKDCPSGMLLLQLSNKLIPLASLFIEMV